MAVEQTTTSKEKVLKKIRQALIFKSKAKYANIDLESNVYVKPEDTTIFETFARNFTSVQGQFVICDNKFDFIDKFLTLIERKKLKSIYCWEDELQQQLKDSGITFHGKKDPAEKAMVSLTSCEALIARTGSVLVSSSKNSRELTIYPPIHVVVAYTSQVVMELKDGMQVLRNKYGKNLPSMLSFITGPSRSNDIDRVMVIGAHGPKELFVFLIDDTASSVS